MSNFKDTSDLIIGCNILNFDRTYLASLKPNVKYSSEEINMIITILDMKTLNLVMLNG